MCFYSEGLSVYRFTHQGFLSVQQFCDTISIYLPAIFHSPSPDSLADSLEQPPAQTDRQNGGHSDAAREGKEQEAKRKGSQEDSSTAGPSRGREEGGERSQHKVQVRVVLPDRMCQLTISYLLTYVFLKFLHKNKHTSWLVLFL